MKFNHALTLTLATAAACLPHTLTAQPSYPDKPIRLIVPYAAGGPVDAVARIIADGLRTTLKQPVLVDNKPGAGGNIGVDLAAKAPADGYTLVMGAVATHAINPALAGRGGPVVSYDPLKDFAPVALAASIPNVLVVNKAFAADNNITSFTDFVRVLKAKPARFDMASGGTGSAGHLAGELLKSQLGIYAVHIPYSGAAPAVASVLAGQTQFMFDNLASASVQIKAQKVLALAVTTAKPAAMLPNVPTIASSKLSANIASFDIGTWFGIFAPSNTPSAVVIQLNQVVRATLSSPANAERLKTLGSSDEPMLWSAEQFKAFVIQQHSKYDSLVKTSKVQIE